MTADNARAPVRPLSVNRYVCDGTVPFPRFAAAACAAGMAAVGVTRAAIGEMGTRGLAACLRDNGLAVSSVNSAGYFTARDTGATERENFALVEAAAELGAAVLCVISGGLGTPVCPPADARRRVAEGFATLAARAAGAGVTLGLEPIHPSGILTKGCINSCADALDLIAPHPAAKLILDLAHSWWDPGLRQMLYEHRERVALVQVCNIRIAGDAVVGRDTLGAGALDLASILPDLLRGGYDGMLELELFETDLGGRDPLRVVAEFPGEIDLLVGGRRQEAQFRTSRPWRNEGPPGPPRPQ